MPILSGLYMIWSSINLPLQAKEYFEKAADNEEAGGHYNLGVVYLKGLGVKRDLKRACDHFMVAANAGQPKAFYQLAKMFHYGVGLKKDLTMVKLSFWIFFQYDYSCIFYIFTLLKNSISYMLHSGLT